MDGRLVSHLAWAAPLNSRLTDRLRVERGREPVRDHRALAEETPVAIVHDGSTTAVMMATPSDLEDFAVGFSLTEGIISRVEELRALDVVHGGLGIELRGWLASGSSGRLAARRRRLVGPTGCGLCGIDSLGEAMRPPPPIAAPIAGSSFTVSPDALFRAMAGLEQRQPLGRETRAVHAAGLWREGQDLIVREDVGRHNALDKLVGAAARGGGSPVGVVLLTSRVSVEMIQKTAALGAPIVCAVSAPTALAVQMAEAANLTLVAVARRDGFEVFTHSERIVFG